MTDNAKIVGRKESFLIEMLFLVINIIKKGIIVNHGYVMLIIDQYLLFRHNSFIPKFFIHTFIFTYTRRI